jgi:excisionase family DNA binding protein
MPKRKARRLTKQDIMAHEARQEITSIEEVAKRLNVGINQVYRACNRGELPAIRIGRRWLVPTAALDRLLRGEVKLSA